MIKNFADHAANERTFLSWVRTAIAIIGFGIVVERMDLFGGPSMVGSTTTGLLLVGVGIVLLAVSGYRFLVLRRQISDEAERPAPPIEADLLLAVVLGILALAVAIFALHVVGPRG